MKDSKVKTYIKIIINDIIFILAVLFLLLVLPRLLSFFMPFVIGWIVAMIANPLVRFLEKKVKILRKHGSAIIIVLVILIIVGVASLLISVLIREAKGLIEQWPAIEANINRQFKEIIEYLDRFTASLPEGTRKMIDNAVDEAGASVTNYISNLSLPSMGSAGSIVNNIAEGFLMVIITILSAYFFAAGRDELAAGLKKHLPESFVDYWKLVYGNFTSAFGGYFKAQFKIMLILLVIMFVGFEVLQVSFSFLIALGIALLDVLPVFGTGAVLWPWAIVEMITGHYFRAIVLVVIYLICQIVKQVLQPKMVGDSVGLNPLATLLFMYIGYKLYGVIGMIIFIPIGMVVVNMYRIGMFDRLIKGFKIIAHDLNEFRKF